MTTAPEQSNEAQEAPPLAVCSNDQLAIPHRFQLSRKKGWRMPPNTVKVDRTTKWGNPWTFENSGTVHPALRFACETAPLWELEELRGKNLACWCALDAECHADVLLELANAAITGSEAVQLKAQLYDANKE